MTWRSLLALTILPACAMDLTDPPRELPDASYRPWWQEAQRCVGVSADLSRVDWVFVDAIDDAPQAAGRWRPPHEITILNLHRENKRVVQHEMIHDLLQQGDEAHGHRCFRLPTQ